MFLFKLSMCSLQIGRLIYLSCRLLFTSSGLYTHVLQQGTEILYNYGTSLPRTVYSDVSSLLGESS